MNYPKPIYLKVGWKRSSFRRRLITASKNPSYYNNFNNNKIKIDPIDCKNEDDFFKNGMKNRSIDDPKRKILYGFFHPYANNGGGGEKVLWQAVNATLMTNDNNIAVIYTVNFEEPAKIIRKVESKFNITLQGERVVFIYLRKFGNLIDSEYWKHFTLVGQLIGSVLLAFECLFELAPDIWIDTIGLPGSYWPISVVLNLPILAYVHYPILQQDMFNKLKFSKMTDLFKFRGEVKDLFKFFYWSILYYVYVYLGSNVDITLANGTWTFNHMKKIWFLNEKMGSTLEVLYPPCATEFLNPYKSKERLNEMIYIAQFRSEKRHDLILTEFSKFLDTCKTEKVPISKIPKIIFLGSCRNENDTDCLNSIKSLVTELELSEYVEFIVDCSYDEILKQLSTVKFGLNSMWNEHFGIGVVEYLANGVIPIVHASAGPILDIATNENSSTAESWKSETGFFFKSSTDPDFSGEMNGDNLVFDNGAFPELSTLLSDIFANNKVTENDLDFMRQVGQGLSNKFSNDEFNTNWRKYTRELASLEKHYREQRKEVESVY
ncbi:GDP-Man:Man(3)GlcNAc(2)-PP-Dol alpha-1,2-mannosyltransferase [[Candida] jaroonii]|uniref:GDP-Man:Man(3)GlcNAc(2)-PP-Dol alpha-1,2-mannosyltransferase n=1 Tax=[Candida] jaroonii TaxID=467808 RepID=A0ACA9YA00_9ASCO|nr:GDP-Man:Man(3)GlcNAc(2)-PP-Dol alpha-1,2-mannosyltransferase [[Candida] jaroonii]